MAHLVVMLTYSLYMSFANSDCTTMTINGKTVTIARGDSRGD